MPEYLTPGVYVEETSFRSRSIEGVPTSTAGMAGATEYGPVAHPANNVAMATGPVLVTSPTEYERFFGGLTIDFAPCRLALAARSFFANGGRRLYVQRVFVPTADGAGAGPDGDLARLDIPAGANPPRLQWCARWPGTAGARVRVAVRFRRSKNVQVGTSLRTVLPGAAVETAALDAQGRAPSIPDEQAPTALRIVKLQDGALGYDDGSGGFVAPAAGQAAFHITLDVEVRLGDRVDVYNGLELGSEHRRYIREVLQDVDPADDACLVWLTLPTPAVGQPPAPEPTPIQMLTALLAAGPDGAYLVGGSEGGAMSPAALEGEKAGTDTLDPATGLNALGEIDDIAIVAMPDTTNFDDLDNAITAVDALLGHCEQDRYRIAIIDPPQDSSISEVRAFRSRFDSKYGALYYPWLRIVDPTQSFDPELPAQLLDVPPSGAVAGIYARSDIERGVHKAPANEVVRGITQFVTNVTYDRQSVLNPEGINALRFFEGRANRVWGARTISSDPEWKYVNVRRLFIYLEHSIDKATQWAVFEPNNERLWGSVRQSIEDFLISVWQTGALMGTRPEEAFFVRCDRTTMTQNDLDNGRMICLIGVAPTYPAEFVIFRIGQWTADSRRS
ncbi:phage tail sheath subtilisin-like domain-containing protein [Nocardioides sp. zg-1230]|uniref:phage tail sheath family protein n=1 Tax=Nocardioides sp. zg-1230 TaxID=2736601 RepID=UPI0015534160|nr:phage tail sheath subtilisin-like domain-containing protein [Nocardioides sp. zg-1230]NPC44580.1 phage tail sheath family protein [Nocardioides sp. zg-1230]